ncbi:hypothetical protein ABEB36_011900 [Hypothenemus hampei]|uniref:Uncharacterized protein n=1 Tax=Hypothenemus hampei TaxID=57062 RepID=A0ABD1EA80_HYPHA
MCGGTEVIWNWTLHPKQDNNVGTKKRFGVHHMSKPHHSGLLEHLGPSRLNHYEETVLF